MIREHNERMSLAWHTAALPMVKKFPKLETMLMRDGPKQARRQSVDEQIAIAMQWTAATSR